MNARLSPANTTPRARTSSLVTTARVAPATRVYSAKQVCTAACVSATFVTSNILRVSVQYVSFPKPCTSSVDLSKNASTRLQTAIDLCTTLVHFSDIDECLPEPCQNNATCVDLVDAFDCTCLVGYTGTVCETSKLVASCMTTTAVF